MTAGAALFITAEDDKDEIHRRLVDIAASEGVELGSMSDLCIRSLAGKDALLVTLDPRTATLTPTALFTSIEDEIRRRRPEIAVLDTLADFFPGNENDRVLARQFIALLRGVALRQDTAIVLLSHPSLTGLSSGTGASGSTGWSNSVRSRLYLEREKAAGAGEIEDPDARILSVKKSNYGPVGETLRLRWQNGIFVAEGNQRPDRLSKAAAQNQADEVFLDLLDSFRAAGRDVSDKPGHGYAPALFEKSAEGKGITAHGFRAAMERLFTAKRIALETIGPPSRQRRRIARFSEGGRDAK